MYRKFKIAIVLLAIAMNSISFAQTKNNPLKSNTMTIDQTKQESLGKWESLAIEIRPSNTKNADGTLKPFYLTRKFTFLSNDKFELTVINFADSYGKVPLAKIEIKGHMEWRGEHPIAPGAQKVDFIADEAYLVTPLLQGFAEVLNQYTKGFNSWTVGEPQNILGKAFAPFGLAEGQIFKEYDLIYLNHGLMFWGARNIDGRGFDTEENRPTNLQIPMGRTN
ncbi:MAG: hypothetical protein JWM14_3367 [Chitinophagaceae bacterium]|nr:hypothetical protein [Chitinophagaceae bacterium]